MGRGMSRERKGRGESERGRVRGRDGGRGEAGRRYGSA